MAHNHAIVADYFRLLGLKGSGSGPNLQDPISAQAAEVEFRPQPK